MKIMNFPNDLNKQQADNCKQVLHAGLKKPGHKEKIQKAVIGQMVLISAEKAKVLQSAISHHFT